MQRNDDFEIDDLAGWVDTGIGVSWDLYDHNVEPAPVTCGCGVVGFWSWWEPPPRLAHIAVARPRWFRPSVSPCERCQDGVERDQTERSLLARQKRAGVPERFRSYRMDVFVTQDGGEPSAEFRRRVMLAHRPTIGVAAGNGSAFIDLHDWDPAKRLGVFLHGPVGVGKSLLCAAMATKMLGSGDEEWKVRTDEEMRSAFGESVDIPAMRRASRDRYLLRYSSSMEVFCTTEAELVRRQELSWSKDKDPLGRACEVPLLLLDDLGTSPMNSAKQADYVTSQIERLICGRYDRNLPTFITSNVSWNALMNTGHSKPGRYGFRVGDRLAQMMGAVHLLGGESWRRS